MFKYISSALLNTGSRAFYFPMTIAVPTASNTVIQQKGFQQEMLWKHWKRADCSNETNEAFPLSHTFKFSASYKHCMPSVLVHQYLHNSNYCTEESQADISLAQTMQNHGKRQSLNIKPRA